MYLKLIIFTTMHERYFPQLNLQQLLVSSCIGDIVSQLGTLYDILFCASFSTKLSLQPSDNVTSKVSEMSLKDNTSANHSNATPIDTEKKKKNLLKKLRAIEDLQAKVSAVKT